MKRLAFMSVAAIAALSGAVSAQTANALSGALPSASASEMTSILSEFGITTEMRASQRPGAAPVLVAATEGGAKFLVSFFNCADAANAAGCQQMMISTAQSSAGVEFADINQFNGTANVTTVVFEPTSQILIFGRNVFMTGGVARENLKIQVYLFLQDMQNFVTSRSDAGAASVSFRKMPHPKSKIDGLTATPSEDTLVMRAGQQPEDRSLEIEIAISNAASAGFAVAKPE